MMFNTLERCLLLNHKTIMQCLGRLNDLKPRKRYQYIRDLKALAARLARARLTTLCYLRASFLEKPRRTRRGRFDKVSSYFWFTVSEGSRHRGTDGESKRERMRAGERERPPERFNDHEGGKWVVWWVIRGVIPVPKVSLQLDSTANCYDLNR